MRVMCEADIYPVAMISSVPINWKMELENLLEMKLVKWSFFFFSEKLVWWNLAWDKTIMPKQVMGEWVVH